MNFESIYNTFEDMVYNLSLTQEIEVLNYCHLMDVNELRVPDQMDEFIELTQKLPEMFHSFPKKEEV